MKILHLGNNSISIELESNNPYYHEKEYDIYLNNEFYKKNNLNVFTIFNLKSNEEYELDVLGEKLKFKTKKQNVILNLDSFGVIKDGIHDETAKIQAAIACAPDDSTIFFPKGTYLVSSLFLKSNINLYFSDGTKIIAMTDRLSYPILPGNASGFNFGVWEGALESNFASIFNLINVSNVSLIGNLELDCRAKDSDWYINHRVKNIAYRGHAIFLNRSNNITISGLYIHDTQSWAVHPYFSSNVNLINLHIKNDPNMPTTDGIDPDCSNNINIFGCIFDVGDDCIAIKSGTYDLALKYKKKSENIYIKNNLMLQGHGGVVFGSELSGGIENVFVSKCVFLNTDRGLRIKTRRGRGRINPIKNIFMDNIYMENVKTPFVINMFYNMGPKGGHDEYVWTLKKLPVDEYTPIIENFKFSNMKCYNIKYAAGVFLGLPEEKIKKIELENIIFTYDKEATEGYPVMIEKNFKLKNAGLYALNVLELICNNVKFIDVLGDEIIKKDSE